VRLEKGGEKEWTPIQEMYSTHILKKGAGQKASSSTCSCFIRREKKGGVKHALSSCGWEGEERRPGGGRCENSGS